MEDMITTDIVPGEATLTTNNLVTTTAVITAAACLPLGYLLGNVIVRKYRGWKANRASKSHVVVTND